MTQNRKEPQPAELSEKQLIAINLVAAGELNKTIGETVGVTAHTVSRWRQEPVFQAAVNALLADARAAATDRLRALAGRALDVIEQGLEDTEVAADTRLKTAFRVLELVKLEADSIGPTDAGDIAIRQREQDADRKMREILSGV